MLTAMVTAIAPVDMRGMRVQARPGPHSSTGEVASIQIRTVILMTGMLFLKTQHSIQTVMVMDTGTTPAWTLPWSMLFL